MLYVNSYHWIWYGLGFLAMPRITIMIVLSLHLPNFIPLPLMILGWIFATLRDASDITATHIVKGS